MKFSILAMMDSIFQTFEVHLYSNFEDQMGNFLQAYYILQISAYTAFC